MASSSSSMPAIDVETFFALSSRVNELSNRVQNLEGRSGQGHGSATKPSGEDPFSQDRIEQALKITRSIFSGPVAAQLTADPSELQSPFMVFRVEQTLRHEEFREKMFRWYDEVTPLWSADPTVYRLMVDPAR